MNKLLKFEDYLFDFLFENKKEVLIVISERLRDILSKIPHPVSQALLDLDNNYVSSNKVAYIDYDDDILGNFTYIIPSKIERVIGRDDIYNKNDFFYYFQLMSEFNYPQIWHNKERLSLSLGKVIRKIFPGKFDTQKKTDDNVKVRNYIEEFTNLFLSERQKMKDIFSNIKIVDGNDIIKYYNESKYDYTMGTSTLFDSCMKHNKCGEFLEFYSENDGVKLVVLMSDKKEDKIIARSLLWDISEIDGEKVDRKFLDRIYSVHDSLVNVFKDYARQNGWLYKNRQNMDEDEYIFDTLDNTLKERKMKTTDTFSDTYYFPYLDTLKFYYYDDGFLTNNKIYELHYYHYLTDTDGGPVNFYSNENDDDDDGEYVEYYGEYFTREYIENNMTFSERIQSYIYISGAVETSYYGRWDDYIPIEDSEKSFDEGSAKLKDMQEAIDEDDTVYVFDEDVERDGFISYEYNGDWYWFHPNDKNHFILCLSLVNNYNKYTWDSYKYGHKEWDKDKIFEWKGRKWLNDAEDQKYFDKLVGQLRLFDNKNNIF